MNYTQQGNVADSIFFDAFVSLCSEKQGCPIT
jgi:hypothetical protein